MMAVYLCGAHFAYVELIITSMEGEADLTPPTRYYAGEHQASKDSDSGYQPVSCLFSGCRHLATSVIYLGLKRYSTPTQPIWADKLIRYLCWYKTIPQSAKSPKAPILDNIHIRSQIDLELL